MLDRHSLSQGSQVFVHNATKPPPPDVVEALRRAIDPVEGIAFVYMPVLYAPKSIDPPRYVLYAVMQPQVKERMEVVMRTLASAVASVVPAGVALDIYPVFSPDPTLYPVMRTKTLICVRDVAAHNTALAEAGPT